jgi:hypothetical protein
MRRTLITLLALTPMLVARGAKAADEPMAEKYLLEGRLADGEKALLGALEQSPKDAQARFGLGAIRFVRGVERMVQSFHRFGLRDLGRGMVPFLRLPVPTNPEPRPIRYEDLRAIFEDFATDMAAAEAALAMVDDPAIKLPLHFGLIRLDFDGDGMASDEETLWKIYARLNPGAAITPENSKSFLITFDRGDVAWLRGYCHLLGALADFYLAHDGRDLFNHSAHLAFANPQTPFPFLRLHAERPGQLDTNEIIDAVAMVHMIRLPLSDAKRMTSALRHLEAMIALSRESWKFYEAETDDDHEWIPNPKQHTVIPGVLVSSEMVKGWREFLDEAERILAGKVLVPFWRERAGSRGINLRRVFTEPRGFDLVLWIQGTSAAPYMEDGPITKPEVWARLQRVFAGEFVGFAFWFN